MLQEACTNNRWNRSGSIRFFLIILIGAGGLFGSMKVCSQDVDVGIVGGCSYYLGDLNPAVHFKNIQIAYGIQARYNIDNRWAVKLSGLRGKLKAFSDQSNYLSGRGLSFESDITDISAEAEFNFLEYFIGSGRHFITPYIYAGVGVFFFNPKSGGVALQPLGTEGQNTEGGKKKYSLVSVDIPFGLGMKISVSRKIGFTVFWEMHKTFTDYLDDASGTYYLVGPSINPNDPAQYYSDPTMDHQPGMQRGNSKNNDWYAFAGVSVSYRFIVHGNRRCRDQKFH